ncbi:MAG: hypothetical protein AB203_02360 [Parcubacteria bacterium C7867-008]|nr:MAG: hypothetical protein AB203_02360 [Parcubacteria bacterium C7867-008]
MQTVEMKERIGTSFGPSYAVLNLSKVGLRYFRFMIKSSPKSRSRLLKVFADHPNIGWIFSATGWFNLAVGVWAKDNAEINDISTSIRSVLGKDDKIVYQSELTSLYGFGDRLIGKDFSPMPIIDAVYSPIELTPIELDYIKLLTLDSTQDSNELSEVLGIPSNEVDILTQSLTEKGIIVGYQERINYTGIYYKVFIDTLSKKNSHAVDVLLEKLWTDPKCIYVERANGKYDLEFELILARKGDLKPYLKDFGEYKTAILTENLYTNLYPLNKTANLRAIQEALVGQDGPVIDFRNSKLWYLNHHGADAYLSIYENRAYFETMEKSELDLFDEVASYIRTGHDDIKYSVMDIGSGDGLKGRVFIERLGEKDVKGYYPIDIQPIELAVALRTHQEGAYAKHPTLLDIENLPARFPLTLLPSEEQVYVFFGGTYGNFKSAEINQYLKPIVQPGIEMLISMPIITEGKTEEEIIASYTGTKFQDMTFGPLAQIGFKLEDFETSTLQDDLHVYIAMEDQRLVSSYILKEDVVVLGRTFDKGTTFKMTSSWKPTLDQVIDALAQDFDVKKTFHNKDMSISLVCAKTT